MIIGFACHRCSPPDVPFNPNLAVIPLHCLGRMNPQLLLQAFCKGADGVFLAGNDCHRCPYAQGISSTLNRLRLAQRMLGFLGLEPERVQIWLRHQESDQAEWLYAHALFDMAAELKALGPNMKFREER